MLRQGPHLSERSKRVLGEGRRIASHLGATLYGVAAECDDDNDPWIVETGLGGADKVVLLSGAFAGSDVESLRLSPGLEAVSEALRPALVLMEECADTRAIGPALAVQLGGVFLSDVTAVREDEGSLLLREWSSERLQRREVSASELAVPVVATLSTADLSECKGEDDADIIFFKAPEEEPQAFALLGSEPRDRSLEEAEIIVTAGLGAAHCLPLVDDLANTLGAVRASTRSLWKSGLAKESTVVDWSAQRISPRLNIICGASGSASHLAAIAAGTTIVALGTDPMSAAFRAASFGLLGDLESTLPALTREASEQRAKAA